MLRFILYRLLQAIPVLLVVVTATFFLIRLAPGGPFSADKAVAPEVLHALEARYRLDQPLSAQYLSYLGDLLRGDFGPSFRYPGRSVDEMIFTGLPATAELGLYALLISLLLGTAAGVIAALRPNSAQDYVPMSAAMIGICLPSFLLGPLLILVFGIWLDWLPVSGWGNVPGDKLLPALTLAAGYTAYVARLSRGGMLEVLAQDYIRTARAKGLAGRTVVIRHSFRNAMVPIVTIFGLQFATLLGGSVIIESVFSIPGMGAGVLSAIGRRDYDLAQTLVLIFGLVHILSVFITDMAYTLVDPRIKYT